MRDKWIDFLLALTLFCIEWTFLFLLSAGKDVKLQS